jgi:hypothetical protein
MFARLLVCVGFVTLFGCSTKYEYVVLPQLSNQHLGRTFIVGAGFPTCPKCVSPNKYGKIKVSLSTLNRLGNWVTVYGEYGKSGIRMGNGNGDNSLSIFNKAGKLSWSTP